MCLRLFALEGWPCLYMRVEGSVFCVKRGAQRGATISCVQVAVFEGLMGRGERGHVSPVCGNPALLTSHTLFSRSYKPLMPQKMLSLLWPGTAEGGGHWGGGSQGRRGLAQPEPSMAALPSSPSLFPLPLLSPLLPSSARLSSSRFAQLRHFTPLERIWPGSIGGLMLIIQKN